MSTRPKKPLPSYDPEEIASLLTASITLLDLADTDFAASVKYVDPGTGKADPLGTYTVRSFEQLSEILPAATYRIEFQLPASSTTGPSCTITVKDGDGFTFIAVPGAIAVSRAGFTPTSAKDLFVTTSSLCRA